MALCWEFQMALVIFGNLDELSLGDSHGPFYASELGCLFLKSFSWPLLCLGAWMALRWELLLALALLWSLDGSSLGAFHGLCYA